MVRLSYCGKGVLVSSIIVEVNLFPLMLKGECLQGSVSEVHIRWMVQKRLSSMLKGEIVGIDNAVGGCSIVSWH